jgi:predicted SAM-dependent methyltransferase
MIWQGKAALMHVFSVSPWGNELHYLAQRRATRTLPSSDEKFAETFNHAKQHLKSLVKLSATDFSRAHFYEFGAGWDLAIPLSFYVLGVQSQTLVDIRRLIRMELVNETLRKLQRKDPKDEILRIPGELLNETSSDWIRLLRSTYGIEYLAPCDARTTGLESSSVDAITSTNTLEHIPAKDIRLILRECRRLLRKDGLMSFIIDYQDHYSYADRRITAYNFLKYSESRWRWYNPAFHHQNRLRHSDYLNLFREEGFEVIEQSITQPTKNDLAFLKEASVWEPFRKNYESADLGIRGAHVVLRPVF